ncbi:MAG: PilN domain-containing protein [Planctomycetota bacterium]
MATSSSFLPDDYVRDARDRRSSIIALALFLIVMGAVFAAFLVTNRQWEDVRVAQQYINDATEKAAKEIEEMRNLEKMRAQMVEKADLARSLIEPVPRSVLMATLINTMPENLSLLELELRSEEVKAPKTPATAPKGDPRARRTAAPGAAAAAPKPEASRRRVTVNATGIAPDDLDVSRWMTGLSRVPFLSGIRLEVSEEKEVAGVTMRQFKISMRIEPEADVRGWAGIDEIKAPRNPIGGGAAGKVAEEAKPKASIVPTNPAPAAPKQEIVDGGSVSPALLNEEEDNQ